jgi:hypothetical protein
MPVGAGQARTVSDSAGGTGRLRLGALARTTAARGQSRPGPGPSLRVVSRHRHSDGRVRVTHHRVSHPSHGIAESRHSSAFASLVSSRRAAICDTPAPRPPALPVRVRGSAPLPEPTRLASAAARPEAALRATKFKVGQDAGVGPGPGQRRAVTGSEFSLAGPRTARTPARAPTVRVTGRLGGSPGPGPPMITTLTAAARRLWRPGPGRTVAVPVTPAVTGPWSRPSHGPPGPARAGLAAAGGRAPGNRY